MASSMELSLLFLVVLAAASVSSTAEEVYTVGGETGWTSRGNPNYTAWADSKTFYVGDSLLFTYNNEYHNVLEVSEADYKACKNGSALAKHTSGKDTIAITTTGNRYFICGQQDHCPKGQKLAIFAVHRQHHPESPAPAPAPAPENSASPPAASSIAAASTVAAAFAVAAYNSKFSTT